MSESGKSDRWNSLLETLGVAPSEPKQEPAPLAEQPAAAAMPTTPMIEQPRAISMLRPEKPKAAPKPKPAGKPPAKSASYWSRIAGALGLETPALPDEEKAPEAAPQASTETVPREQSRPAEVAPIEEPRDEIEPEPREEFGRRGGRQERQPRGFERGRREERGGRRRGFQEERPFGIEKEPSGGGEFGEPEAPSRGRGEEEDAPRMREPTTPRRREVEESGSVLDYEAPAAGGSDLSFGEGIEGPATAEEELQEGGGRRRRRRRRGRGRRGSGESAPGEATRNHEEDIEPAGEDVDFDFERDDELETDVDISSERESRPRGRRGGPRTGRGDEDDRYPPPSARSRESEEERGGRSRRHEARASRGEARQKSDYEVEPSRHEHAARPPRASAPPTSRNEDLELDLGDEHDEELGGNVPTHKKIPTWDEAVGILIDANMATRGNSDRERGRGRGRGRR